VDTAQVWKGCMIQVSQENHQTLIQK